MLKYQYPAPVFLNFKLRYFPCVHLIYLKCIDVNPIKGNLYNVRVFWTYIMLWIDSSSFDTKSKYHILSKMMRNTEFIIKHEN